jgi:WhiB family redox-sensing transcriptional regulator
MSSSIFSKIDVEPPVLADSRAAQVAISLRFCHNDTVVITGTQVDVSAESHFCPLLGGTKTMHEEVESLSHERGWQDQANCLGVDPDLFFPERGASTREAKEVCKGCIVRGECLEYALANGEKFGIWGGLSERERRRLRRQRAQENRRIVNG